MKQIVILTDYKGYFGSKQKSQYYNSGFDLEYLSDLFKKKGYNTSVRPICQINFRTDCFTDTIVLYTSSEDRDLFYKQFIEDILLGVKLKGGILIPEFLHFRAHNNKVFMEILRDTSSNSEIKNISSSYFGTLEEIKRKDTNLDFPIVYKAAAGSKSRGVGLATNFHELERNVRKISRTLNLWDIFKEFVRKYKYKGYIQNSSHRKKFIVQNFIEGLNHDFKILVFEKKFYIIKRNVKPNDFRASGQGLLEFTDDIPFGLFDFAERIYNSFNVPFISLDIAYNGFEFILLEFQTIYFGTYTLEFSEFYFTKSQKSWVKVVESSEIEAVFADAIDSYIIRNLFE